MDKLLRRTTFLLLILLVSMQVDAFNNYYFSIINSNNGLSHASVKAMLQDSDGFLWFGTRNKLNRFDGIKFKVYNCYDSKAERQNNNISSLFEDRDKHLWVGTDKGVFVLDRETEEFTFLGERTEEGITIVDWIADIKEDRDGNIWIVVPNQGLFRYLWNEKKLRLYTIGMESLPDHGNPQSLCIDESGKVWVGTNGKGVYLYNQITDQFTQYLGDAQGNTLKGENIYTMADDGKYLILGIHEGKLRKIDKRNNLVTDVNAPDVHYKIIRYLYKINGQLWVGTQTGIFILNEQEQKVTYIHNDPMSSHSLSDNQINKIYQDREGGVWIATDVGGVNYLSNSALQFNHYIPLNQEATISSKHVREIMEDSQHRIWIGTDDAGVNILSPEKELFQKVGREVGSNLAAEQTLSLLEVDNTIWVGFFKKGLDIVSADGRKVTHISGEQLGLNEWSVYALCQDRHGNIWLGNGWGVYKGDAQTLKFVNVPDFGLSYIYDILEDTEGQLWVATMGNGVFRHNPETKETEHYVNNINDNESLSSNSVNDMIQTSNGDLWFATDRGGVCKYNRAGNSFETLSLAEGLPDDNAYRIVEDKNGYLWFGTNNGLVQLNPQTRDIKVYTTSNGLPSNQFCYKAALASSSGELYFGTFEGLISFYPERLAKNTFAPPVFMTHVYCKNDRGNVRDYYNKADKQSPIVLHYNQSSIEFGFVALSYACPTANRYAYQMEGLDEQWIFTQESRSANYANLSPGKYTFKVKACNNDNVWNEEEVSVKLVILPPWWGSKMAYVGYLLLAMLLFYLIIQHYSRISKKKATEKQQLFESEKEKELYRSKIDFFTNIAHEIRTPLTLINGPLESLAEMDIKDEEMSKDIQLMQKNIAQLFTLVNQILDFRKIDANKVVMNYTDCNISEIVNDTHQEFMSMALSMNRTLSLEQPEKKIFAQIDRGTFIKILNNLYSNAVKYSDKVVNVRLEEQEKTFTFTVLNDGDLVPAEQVDKIFDPFYQLKKNANTNSSSGLGLSLARSLAEMHHGSLTYGTEEAMNVFTLVIPKGETTSEEQVNEMKAFNEESADGEHPAKEESILVVEDNLDLLSFIVEKLSPIYQVAKATNGAEAFDLLEQGNFDLVLTDVMMPVMDGFELCKKLKEDIRFCHIPVVLLTAKNDLDSKIKGLEIGAEAYIEKPFSFKYLQTQLSALLENRKREKEAFINKPYVTSQSIGLCKADEELMNKIISIIEENMTDPNFGVERLSEITNMSRSSLHRKIKALSGTSPTDFIRIIRLKKASKLIADGYYRTGEVCYIVGINSPSYFIKLFQKQFGMTPKEFERSTKNEKG